MFQYFMYEMCFVVPYYFRDEGNIKYEYVYLEKIGFTKKEDYINSGQMEIDLYTIKLELLNNYFENEYTHDVLDNKKKYEYDFDRYFEYTYFFT